MAIETKKRTTRVALCNHAAWRLMWCLPILLVYVLYFTSDWWMGFCAIVVSLAESVPVVFSCGDEKKRDVEVDRLSEILAWQKKKDLTHHILSIFVSITNLFPLLAWLLGWYDLNLMILVVLGLSDFCILYTSYNMANHTKPIKDLIAEIERTGMTPEEAAKKREMNEEEQNLKKYGKGYEIVNRIPTKFVYAPAKKCFECGGRMIKFSDIISYRDKLTRLNTVHQGYSETTTDNGNLLNRAMLGDMVAGRTGAIIGGVTAKKTTISTPGYVSTTYMHTLVFRVKNKDCSIGVEEIQVDFGAYTDKCDRAKLILDTVLG